MGAGRFPGLHPGISTLEVLQPGGELAHHLCAYSCLASPISFWIFFSQRLTPGIPFGLKEARGGREREGAEQSDFLPAIPSSSYPFPFLSLLALLLHLLTSFESLLWWFQPALSFRPAQSNRTFCGDGNVLGLHSPTQWPSEATEHLQYG